MLCTAFGGRGGGGRVSAIDDCFVCVGLIEIFKGVLCCGSVKGVE